MYAYSASYAAITKRIEMSLLIVVMMLRTIFKDVVSLNYGESLICRFGMA